MTRPYFSLLIWRLAVRMLASRSFTMRWSSPAECGPRGGREGGRRERRFGVARAGDLVDRDRAVHPCSGGAQHAEQLEQFGSLGGRQLVERLLAGADQGADGADLRVGRDRLGPRPLG